MSHDVETPRANHEEPRGALARVHEHLPFRDGSCPPAGGDTLELRRRQRRVDLVDARGERHDGTRLRLGYSAVHGHTFLPLQKHNLAVQPGRGDVTQRTSPT